MNWMRENRVSYFFLLILWVSTQVLAESSQHSTGNTDNNTESDSGSSSGSSGGTTVRTGGNGASNELVKGLQSARIPRSALQTIEKELKDKPNLDRNSFNNFVSDMKRNDPNITDDHVKELNKIYDSKLAKAPPTQAGPQLSGAARQLLGAQGLGPSGLPVDAQGQQNALAKLLGLDPDFFKGKDQKSDSTASPKRNDMLDALMGALAAKDKDKDKDDKEKDDGKGKDDKGKGDGGGDKGGGDDKGKDDGGGGQQNQPQNQSNGMNPMGMMGQQGGGNNSSSGGDKKDEGGNKDDSGTSKYKPKEKKDPPEDLASKPPPDDSEKNTPPTPDPSAADLAKNAGPQFGEPLPTMPPGGGGGPGMNGPKMGAPGMSPMGGMGMGRFGGMGMGGMGMGGMGMGGMGMGGMGMGGMGMGGMGMGSGAFQGDVFGNLGNDPGGGGGFNYTRLSEWGSAGGGGGDGTPDGMSYGSSTSRKVSNAMYQVQGYTPSEKGMMILEKYHGRQGSVVCEAPEGDRVGVCEIWEQMKKDGKL